MEKLEDFYNASEARTMLGGISGEELKRYTDAGKIEKFVPPTNKRKGYYKKRDVDRIAVEMKSVRKKERATITFDWLRPQDITAAMDLDYRLYHEHFIGEAQVYQSWRHKNPYISMAAFDANDRRTCLGYVGLIPLKEVTILDILSGKRDEKSILSDEIGDYSINGAYTLLANSAAIHPERPDLLYKILYKIMEFWIEQYPEKYMKKIYAQAISEKGDLLVQHFFMAPRPDLAYNAYELDISRPAASKVMRWFKEQLTKKAPLPPGLQYPPV